MENRIIRGKNLYKKIIKLPGTNAILLPADNKNNAEILRISYNWQRSPMMSSTEEFSIFSGSGDKITEFISQSFSYYIKSGYSIIYTENFTNKNNKYTEPNDGIYIKTSGYSYLSISILFNVG